MPERTIDSSIKELTELKTQTREVTDFLAWKELTSDQYKEEYNKIKARVDDIRKKVNEIYDYLGSQKDNISLNQHNVLQWLMSSFKELKTWFDWLQTPDSFTQKLKEKEKINKPIELGKIDIRSTFNDISLNPEELAKLKPERLLAKTSGWIEYYQITFNWQTTILRYNPNDSWDEVALYANVAIWNDVSNEEIKRIIINAERQWFRDVEMNGTWNLTTAGLAATAWWITWGKLWAWFWSAFTPVWTLIWWVVWWTWWAIIAWISTAWDEDYTSKEYQKDFWNEMDKLKVQTLNYKNK